MENQLNPIYQLANEEVFDFIQRAIEQMKNDHEKYSLVFLDGTTIATYEYDLEDKVTANYIFAEYNSKHIKPREIEIDDKIIETIDILVQAAEENQQTSEKVQELEKSLEELQKAREERIAEIQKELNEDIKNRGAFIEELAKQQKTDICRLQDEKKERINLLNEYKVEIEKQENELNKARTLNPEDLKIALYERNIEQLTQEIARIENDIYNINNRIKEIEDINQELIRYQKEIHKNKYGIELTANNPKAENTFAIREIDEQILEKEEELKYYSRTPSEIKEEIITSMKNGAPKEEVKVQLELLASLVGGPTVKGVIDKKEYQTIKEEIEANKEKLLETEKRYQEGQYINEAKKALDEKDKELLLKRQQEHIAKMETLKKDKVIASEKKNLPSLKQELQLLEEAIKVNEEQRARLEKNRPEIAKKYEEIIKDLKEDRNELLQRIGKIESLPTVKPTIILNGEIERLEATINHEKNLIEILDKKDYTDYDKKEEDRKLMETLAKNIESLEKTSEKMKENDVNQLIINTLNIYENAKNKRNENIDFTKIIDEDEITENIGENELEEVIDSEKSISKKLFEKIKASAFVQKITDFFTAKEKKVQEPAKEEPKKPYSNKAERRLYAISGNGRYKEITEAEISRYIDDGWDVRLVDDIQEFMDAKKTKRNKSM